MNKEEISDYEQHPIAQPLRPAFAIHRALGRHRSHQPDCDKCDPARTDDVEGQRIRLHGINSLPEHLPVYLSRRSLGEGEFVVECTRSWLFPLRSVLFSINRSITLECFRRAILGSSPLFEIKAN